MSLITATGATFVSSLFTLQISDVEADLVFPTEASTVYGSKNYASFEGVGGIHLQLSGMALLDTVNPMPTGLIANPADVSKQTGTFTWTFATGKSISGSCVLSNMHISRPEVGIGKIPVTLTSTGVLTWTWA